VYIDAGDGSKNAAAFEALKADRSAIEAAFGEPLEWEPLESKRACRIAVYREGSIEDSSASLEDYHKWAVDHLLQFKKVFGPRLPALAVSAGF
jgi:hypothetical protein